MIRLITLKAAAIVTMLAMGLTGAAYSAVSARGAQNPDGDRDGSACGETVHVAGKLGNAGFDRDDFSSKGRSSDADEQADQALRSTGVNNANFAQISKLFANGKITRSGRFFVPAWALGHRFAAAGSDDGCGKLSSSAGVAANNNANNNGAFNNNNANNNGGNNNVNNNANNNGVFDNNLHGKRTQKQNARLIADIDKLLSQVQVEIQIQSRAQANGQSSTTLQSLEALQAYLTQLRAELVANNAALASGTAHNGAHANNNTNNNNNNTGANNNNNTANNNNNTAGTQNGQATTVAPSTGAVATSTPGAVGTATPSAGLVPNTGAAGTATPSTGTTGSTGVTGTATPGTGMVPNTGAAPTNTQLVTLLDQLIQQVQLRIQSETQAQPNGQAASPTLTALQALQACLEQARTFLAGGTPSPFAVPSGTPSAAPSAAPSGTPSPAPSAAPSATPTP